MKSAWRLHFRRLGTRGRAASTLVIALWIPCMASAATFYDEAIGGDLTANEGTAPLLGALSPGENSVFGQMTDFGDAFKFDLDVGRQITAATLFVASFSGANEGILRLRRIVLPETVETFNFSTNGDFPLMSPPLESDTYLVKIFLSAAPGPTYDYELRITVPEPAPPLTQSWALATLGVVALFQRRWRGATASRLLE